MEIYAFQLDSRTKQTEIVIFYFHKMVYRSDLENRTSTTKSFLLMRNFLLNLHK